MEALHQEAGGGPLASEPGVSGPLVHSASAQRPSATSPAQLLPFGEGGKLSPEDIIEAAVAYVRDPVENPMESRPSFGKFVVLPGNDADGAPEILGSVHEMPPAKKPRHGDAPTSIGPGGSSSSTTPREVLSAAAGLAPLTFASPAPKAPRPPATPPPEPKSPASLVAESPMQRAVRLARGKLPWGGSPPVPSPLPARSSRLPPPQLPRSPQEPVVRSRQSRCSA